MLRRIKDTLDANIDYGGAVAAAALLGSVVFWLNRSHGVSLATTAALKQATYTFFVAGFIVKNNERVALKRASPAQAVVLAATVSSCLAVGLTFLVHSLKGTPEPVLSTLPTALMGPPGFLLLAWRARRGFSNSSATGPDRRRSPTGRHGRKPRGARRPERPPARRCGSAGR